MRTVVMTGGTSGFGAIAARRIAADPEVRLLVGTRGSSVPDGAEAVPLDLASLTSVRSFADAVSERVGVAGIDVMVLNAGTLNPNVDGRTAEGFETAFAVNHLGQYLLLRLLLDHLVSGATVVLTTSGTRDPAEGPGFRCPGMRMRVCSPTPNARAAERGPGWPDAALTPRRSPATS